MTDTSIDRSAFVHADDELMFDDEIAPVPAPQAAQTPPRKGRGKAAPPHQTESAAVPEPVVEEPAGAPAPIPPSDAAPAGSTPSPDAPRRDRMTLLLAAIVGFALLTSLVSLGAMIAVGRSLAAANAERMHATVQADALARIPAIVGTLDAASARLAQLAAVAPASVAPATQADVHAAIDGLKLALSQRQPDGVAPIAGTLREGFSEIDTRLDRIEDRMAPRPRDAGR